MEPPHQQGIRILFHLNDILILSPLEETARLHARQVVEHFTLLGFATNWKKCAPFPGQQVVYLNIQLDSTSMTARLPAPHQGEILSALHHFHPHRHGLVSHVAA